MELQSSNSFIVSPCFPELSIDVCIGILCSPKAQLISRSNRSVFLRTPSVWTSPPLLLCRGPYTAPYRTLHRLFSLFPKRRVKLPSQDTFPFHGLFFVRCRLCQFSGMASFYGSQTDAVRGTRMDLVDHHVLGLSLPEIPRCQSLKSAMPFWDTPYRGCP